MTFQAERPLWHPHSRKQDHFQLSAADDGMAQHWRHGDLKPQNILIFNQMGQHNVRLKICDLRLAKSYISISKHRKDLDTTVTYHTPEFDIPEREISRSPDIFSNKRSLITPKIAAQEHPIAWSPSQT